MKYALSIVAVLGVALSSTPVFSSEQSHAEAARKLIEVIDLDKTLDDMYKQMNAVFLHQYIAKDPCVKPVQQQLTAVFEQYTRKALNPEVIKSEMLKIYTQEFTEEELNKITEFYKTPAGKKALQKTPELMQKGMQIAQREMNSAEGKAARDELNTNVNKVLQSIDPKTLSPECQARFQKQNEQMKQSQQPAAPAVPAAPNQTTPNATTTGKPAKNPPAAN